MRSLLFILLAAVQAFALNNAVVVYDASGSTQSHRVVKVSRVFARGEITDCAEAYYSGAPIPTQTDVKVRWSDGSLKHAIVSFELASLAANGTATVEFRNTTSCNNSSYQNYSTLTSTLAWGAQLETTANSITQSRSAKTMLTDCGSISTDPYSGACRYYLRGPLVTQVIVEDRTPARTEDFGYQYTGGAWQLPSSDIYKSLHPIFVVTFYTPSSGQPYVHVQTIVEDMWMDRLQSQVYSFQIKTGSPLSTVYTRAATWNQPGRTRWRIDRWSGTPPGDIFVDYNLPYLIHARAVPQWDLSTPLLAGAQSFDLATYDSNIGSEEPALCPASSSRCADWLKAMAATGGRGDLALFPRWYGVFLHSMGNSNFGLAERQEIYQKLFLGNALAAGNMNQHWRESLTDRCFDESGATKYANSAGCNVNAFGYTFSISARPTGRSWVSGSSDPDDRMYAVCSTGECNVDNANGWSATDESARAHQPELAYLPYIITGDWYFAEEMQHVAASQLTNPPFGNNQFYERHTSWGFLNFTDNQRWWNIRDIAHPAYILPDADPAKPYYLQKLADNAAVLEGLYGITDGLYYDPTTGSRWYWGRHTIGAGNPNPLALSDRRSPGYYADEGINREETATGERRFYLSHRNLVYGWLDEILPEVVGPLAEFLQRELLDWTIRPDYSIRDLGWLNVCYTWPARPSTTTWYQTPDELFNAFVLNCTLSADITSTTSSTLKCKTPTALGNLLRNTGPSRVFQIDNERVKLSSAGSTATVGPDIEYTLSMSKRGFQDTVPATHTAGTPVTRVYALYDSNLDAEGGYPVLYRATLSFLADKRLGGLSGSRVWEWHEQVKGPIGGNNPQYSFVPRDRIDNLGVAPASNAVLIRFDSRQESGCSGLISTSPIVSSFDNADTAIPTNLGLRQWTATGLASGTTYYARVTCGTARTYFTFHTLTSGGSVAYQTDFAAAPFSANNVLVEVAATPAMTNPSTATATCASGCSVTVPGLTAGSLYYVRHTWRTAGNAAISASQPAPFVAH